MLLAVLIAVLAVFFPDLEHLITAFLVISLALEAGLLVIVHRSAIRALPAWFGVIVLEELLVISCLGEPYLETMVTGGRLALFLGAGALAGLLLARLPLPEALLPLRGRWLRRLLARVTVAALLYCGPWWYAWTYAWQLARPSSPVQPLLAVHLLSGACVLIHAWSALVAGWPGRGSRILSSVPAAGTGTW